MCLIFFFLYWLINYVCVGVQRFQPLKTYQHQSLISSGQSSYNGNAPVPAPLIPISHQARPDAAFDTESDFFIPTTTLPLDANVTGFSAPYNLSQITWLQNKTEIKFPSSNNSYSVFPGDLPPKVEYQSCMIPNSNNTLGHCRHLAHCIIPQILSSFADFIPYGEQCVIDARFVGICCPKQYAQKLESTTGPSNTSIPTLAPLLQTSTA